MESWLPRVTTIIKINKGISLLLFSEEKETKAFKSDPTFQRPLWSQERESTHLSQVVCQITLTQRHQGLEGSW